MIRWYGNEEPAKYFHVLSYVWGGAEGSDLYSDKAITAKLKLPAW